jgi:hypothetical protein
MALDIETKLDLISTEIKRRLRLAFPNTKLYEGSGGVWGVWNQVLPCIHIFELMTTRQISIRGVYTVVQPIQIEYVAKLQDRDKIYSEGRAKKLILQKALELDEYLVQNKGMSVEGSGLAINYYMKFDEIVEVIPNTVDCAVQYEFAYTEKFYGYNPT